MYTTTHEPLLSNCRLQFMPDIWAEVNAIGLQHLLFLDLGKGNLSKCQDEVSNADRSLLHPVGMLKTRLTFGSAAVNTTISVFHDIDDCLLSWYDARALNRSHLYTARRWNQWLRKFALRKPVWLYYRNFQMFWWTPRNMIIPWFWCAALRPSHAQRHPYRLDEGYQGLAG